MPTNWAKKCGLVIVANNLLAQEPESRRIYADGVTPDLFLGIAMVVSSPVARVIGNLALHLRTLQVPINVVEKYRSGASSGSNPNEKPKFLTGGAAWRQSIQAVYAEQLLGDRAFQRSLTDE